MVVFRSFQRAICTTTLQVRNGSSGYRVGSCMLLRMIPIWEASQEHMFPHNTGMVMSEHAEINEETSALSISFMSLQRLSP